MTLNLILAYSWFVEWIDSLLNCILYIKSIEHAFQVVERFGCDELVRHAGTIVAQDSVTWFG